MSLGDEFRRVASVVEGIESNGVPVVSAERVSDADGDDSVRVRVELDVPLEGDLPFAVATDGAKPAQSAPDPEADLDEGEAETDAVDADGDDADTVDEGEDMAATPCRHPDCGETFETEHGMKIHYTKTHVSDDDPPAYRDPARLREAYESCETFEEMREHLDADVTVTTIRRQLLDHGIHESGDELAPDRDSMAEAEEADEGNDPTETEDVEPATETDETDGPDEVEEPIETEESEPAAPEADASDDVDETTDGETDASPDDAESREVAPGVTLAQLFDAVEGARTLYDVERALDVDRETAMDLLRRFELLEAVHGRVTDEETRTELREQVTEQFDLDAGSAD